jgi:hypothetical protein
MASDFITSALASAHKAIDATGPKGTSSIATRSGHSSITPKSAGKPAVSDYAHARAARPGGSFMGVQADQGSELKAAEQNREAAKKVIDQ